MGKKRSRLEDEHDGPFKKLKRNEHHPPGRSNDKVSDKDRYVGKHFKKSSHKHKSKHKSKHRKNKKRKHHRDCSSSDESSSSDSTSTSSSTSTDSEKKKRRRIHKEKKRKHNKSKYSKVRPEKIDKQLESITESCIGPLPPEDLNKNSRSMAPMTKEEWEKRQSVVKRVYDEETGRHRLIKGDGEILEEIVSRDRHKEINRLATKGDGAFFESSMHNKLQSKTT
ncbi:ADP-ribosylation factor-like protein 6-interacting protein 4 [Hetaerina americana]|uniref:ADP-ribosylation factor-like protein 6-interacting protein 4 n=1 Tax=Hetaerina americana TaxID=62018 RepID=UPI003A7F3BE2